MRDKHIIYLAGLLWDAARRYKSIFPDDEINSLLSNGRVQNGYLKTFVDNRDLFNSVCIDSGTWTLNNVSEDKYVDKADFLTFVVYLKCFEGCFDFYLNYDEDFSLNSFNANHWYQLKLESKGFKPVFVIHNFNDPVEMDYCLNGGHKMVAIGSGELSRSTVDELYKIVEPFYQKGIKVHFLGCTRYEKLAKIPVYSCDSSTWTRMGAEGYVLWWNPAKQGFDKTDKIYFKPIGKKSMMEHFYQDYQYQWEFDDYLRLELGLKPYQLQGRGTTDRLIFRALVNIKYFVELQERVRKEHSRRGFIFH